uniref:Uncharacterized protein n=1 Tax=Oreochromis niloticus TaxID=8128 RepID=A0A669B9P9_ORENI
MKNHFALPSCLLLLWTFTDITVNELAEGIKVICPDSYEPKETTLEKRDNNTKEYTCTKSETEKLKIYVKFRSCDNCVELDIMSIAGMVIGNVVATIVIGVGVYLLASQTRTGPVVSNRKSKSKECLSPLRRAGQRDTYDELVHRK